MAALSSARSPSQRRRIRWPRKRCLRRRTSDADHRPAWFASRSSSWAARQPGLAPPSLGQALAPRAARRSPDNRERQTVLRRAGRSRSACRVLRSAQSRPRRGGSGEPGPAPRLRHTPSSCCAATSGMPRQGSGGLAVFPPAPLLRFLLDAAPERLGVLTDAAGGGAPRKQMATRQQSTTPIRMRLASLIISSPPRRRVHTERPLRSDDRGGRP